MNKQERMKASEDKFQAFKAALVAKYGEGSVVTFTEMAVVYESGDYAKWRDIAKNQDYKLGRNQFVVTMSNEPSKVRDLAKHNMEKLEKAKQGQMLPKAVRKSAKKLVEAMGDVPKVKAERKTRKVDVSKASKTFDNSIPHADGEENINDVLRVMQD